MPVNMIIFHNSELYDIFIYLLCCVPFHKSDCAVFNATCTFQHKFCVSTSGETGGLDFMNCHFDRLCLNN
jgi:hypothetical protein